MIAAYYRSPWSGHWGISIEQLCWITDANHDRDVNSVWLVPNTWTDADWD